MYIICYEYIATHGCHVHDNNAFCLILPYSGYISLGANFPEWSVLSFSRNFPNSEIHHPNNQKTHMSKISEFTRVYEHLDTSYR